MLRRPIVALRINLLLHREMKTRLRRVPGTLRIAEKTTRPVRKIELRPGPKPASPLRLAPTTKWRVHRRITGRTRHGLKTGLKITKSRKPLRPNALHARRTLLTPRLLVRTLPVQRPHHVRKANRSRNGRLGHRLNVRQAPRVRSHINRRHDRRLRLIRKRRPVRRSPRLLLARKSLRRKNTNHKSV